MADVLDVASAQTNLNITTGLHGPLFISPTIAVKTFHDDLADLMYQRTTNANAASPTWTDFEITTAVTEKSAVWLDKETPEYLSSDLLHICWIEETDAVLRYVNLDIGTNSLGTPVLIDTLVSGQTAQPSGTSLSITRLRNGDLMIAGRVNTTGADPAFAYISTNGGADWSPMTTPHEGAAADRIVLFPANTGTDSHAACLYLDPTTNEWSIKMWNGTSWTEKSISTLFVGLTGNYPESHYSAHLRHSDGAIILVSWTQFNNPAADLKVFSIQPNSIADPPITTLTDILTDTDLSGMADLVINQQTGAFAVAYGRGGVWEGSQDIRYKISTDGGTTWGTETAYSEDLADDYRSISGPGSIAAHGGWIRWSWYDQDDNDILTNLNNDIEVQPANQSGGGGGYPPILPLTHILPGTRRDVSVFS